MMSTVSSQSPKVGISELELPQTTSSMDGSIHFISFGGLIGNAAVLIGRLVADLPRAVHFVAQAPQPDVERAP